jgi:hypothetical protein
MTPLLSVTTVLGLGAICNLFESQHRAVTEQAILNVHICYPDTIDQGQQGNTRQYVQGCCTHVELCLCTQPNTIHSWHFQVPQASVPVICAYSWLKVGPIREAIWFAVQVWCIFEVTDAKPSTPGIQRQKPWQCNLLCNTIDAGGFVGMKSLQK